MSQKRQDNVKASNAGQNRKPMPPPVRRNRKEKPKRNPIKTQAQTVRREETLLKEVEKKIIQEKDSIGRQVSNLIQQIDKKLNYKALTGQVTSYDLNTAAYAIFFQRLMDRYAMTTPLFISQGNRSDRIYPVDFLMFCWISLLLHLREVGTVTGDLSEVPSFVENMSIPVPLASILQYIGRYDKGDLNISTQYTLPTGFFSATLSNGHFDPALPYPFAVVNEGQLVDSLVVGPYSEYAAVRDWLPLTVQGWCQTRMFKVANGFRRLNIPTVPLRQIPEYAPGPEAYCCRGADARTGFAYTNRVFTVSKPFDAELGTIFSIGRNFEIREAYLSETIPGFMTNPGYGYGTFSIEGYLAAGCVYLLMQQDVFRHGPIKRVYSLYRRNKVTTFAWSSKLIDGPAIQAVFATTWRQIQRQVPVFNDVQGANSSFRQFYALYSLFILHLHHRVEMASPIANLALRISGVGAHSISAYYNEGVAERVAIPAALERLITTTGVVLSHGSMVFPRFPSMPNVPAFTWGDPAWDSNLLAMSWKGFKSSVGAIGAYPFFWDGAGVTFPPNMKTAYSILDAAYGALYTTPAAGFPYPVQHPQNSLSEFVAVWNTTTSNQVFKELATTMVSKKSNLESKFGTIGQMLSQTGGTFFVNRIDLFESSSDLTLAIDVSDTKGLGSAAPLGKVSVSYVSPSTVTSSVILNGSESLEAITIPNAISLINFDLNFSPYICKMSVTSSNLLLEELIDLTTQAGVNNSAVDSHQPPQLLVSNTGHIVPVKAEDHSDGPSKWELAVAQTGQKTIPPVVGTAAGIACDFIPLIGAFLSPICAAGASGIVSSLMSRGTSTGQDFAKPVPASDAYAKVTAVKSGVTEMSRLIGASGEVVKKTSETLSRMAASQLRGSVNPMMLEAVRNFHKRD